MTIEHVFAYGVTMLQGTFDDLGTPLRATRFVVIDLETTGGSAEQDTITEVGALACVGGEVQGTFQTLVRPAGAIHPHVALLTGITDAMVAPAPPIEEILPNLFEFLQGAVVVAHNARFDCGFLSSAFRRHGYPVPFKRSVCTLNLARRLLRGETRDMRLGTLAQVLGAQTQPCHRAFADAEAAMQIFHRLLEMAGSFGVVTIEDLFAFTRAGSRPAVAKAKLAARVPRATGVYRFLDRSGKVLYVGKAKDLRSRVRSYFYGDPREKVNALVRLVDSVDIVRTTTELEAEVLELRMIKAHDPPFNRRGRRKGRREAWVKIEGNRRIVAGRTPGPRPLAGPFASSGHARELVDAIRDAMPIHRCTDPRRHPQGCAFGEMGRCVSPCMDGEAAHSDLLTHLIEQWSEGRPDDLLEQLTNKMLSLSQMLRFEEAAAVRDSMSRISRAARDIRLASWFQRMGDIVIASGGGHHVLVRGGRFVRSTEEALPADPRMMFLDAVGPAPGPVTLDALDEMKIIYRHLSRGWKVVHPEGITAEEIRSEVEGGQDCELERSISA